MSPWELFLKFPFVATKVDVAICILKSRLIGQTGREKNLLGPLRELPNILCLFKLQVLDPVWKQHPVYEFSKSSALVRDD